MSKIFRSPSNKRWRTENLFVEFEFKNSGSTDQLPPMYTLKKEPFKGYPSLYLLYMEMEDLTEVDFARAHLGGYRHWKTLSKSSWFKPHLEEWREELEVRLMAKGLKTLKEVLRNDDAKLSDRMFAAKFFANRGWEEAIAKTPAARPEAKKKDLVKIIKNQLDSNSNSDDDFERLISGGQVNSNGPKLSS